ncbi:Retinol dehydrogenase 13 [Holothuria leucospilota]|uniref:Retinol dehydrogenase 13 n=1 Tax=Holothuria leucospilota TaxID=206669 RepID=A0A9Q0YM10_HOLLE|nr:Retinol dehydrogenase 13 [Holothuria leucospilota]
MALDLTSILLIVIFVGAVLIFLLRRWSAGGWCYSKARLDGKTVLITGANTGIGKMTAIDLARRGAKVILACRNLDKAKSAKEEIIKASNNSNVSIVELDLASLESVRKCAEKINKEEERLDILINNAGVMACPRWETKDGFEMQLGTNHLGHFLLTNLLLDLIKKSAPARIINVSSLAHVWGDIHFDDLMLKENYSPFKSYSQSKLANVLFCKELAKRLEGTSVTTYALHPGTVDTELGRYIPSSIPLAALILSILYPVLTFLLIKTSEQGAQTSIHCAVDEQAGLQTGLYYSDCAVNKPAPKGNDADMAKKLWEVSAELVGLEKKVD